MKFFSIKLAVKNFRFFFFNEIDCKKFLNFFFNEFSSKKFLIHCKKKFENFLQSISLKKNFENFSENPKKNFCLKKKRGHGGGICSFFSSKIRHHLSLSFDETFYLLLVGQIFCYHPTFSTTHHHIFI